MLNLFQHPIMQVAITQVTSLRTTCRAQTWRVGCRSAFGGRHDG